MPETDRLIILDEEELAQGPSDISTHPEKYCRVVHSINKRVLRDMITSYEIRLTARII